MTGSPASSAAMSRAYSTSASGMWKTEPGAEPGRRAGRQGVAVGAAGPRALLDTGVNKCRWRPTSVATATATTPAPSANRSTPRSLRAAASWLPDSMRLTVISRRISSTTSRAMPMATPSRCSGPSHRWVATAPRNPASPRMISSASGSNRSQ